MGRIVTRLRLLVLIQGPEFAIAAACRRIFGGSESNELVPYIRREARRKRYHAYVDIGAFTGDTLIPVAREFKRCLAVEHSHPSVEELRNRLTRSGVDNCEVEECALSNAEGEGTLNLSETNKQDNSIPMREDLIPGPRVRISTLDALYKRWKLETPILVKVDVQGAEPLVFQGARELLEHDCAVISEFWPWGLKRCGFDPSYYFRLMSDQGYSPCNLKGTPLSAASIQKFIRLSEQSRFYTDILFLKG